MYFLMFRQVDKILEVGADFDSMLRTQFIAIREQLIIPVSYTHLTLPTIYSV